MGGNLPAKTTFSCTIHQNLAHGATIFILLAVLNRYLLIEHQRGKMLFGFVAKCLFLLRSVKFNYQKVSPLNGAQTLIDTGFVFFNYRTSRKIY